MNYLSGIILNLIVGLLSGVITLIGDRWLHERKLKTKYKIFEGEYRHLDKDENLIKSCKTDIIYMKGGKLKLKTITEYGIGEGILAINDFSPIHGSGVFDYINRKEGGSFQIIIKDSNTIYVFPNTLTHDSQKRNFYIMRKGN